MSPEAKRQIWQSIGQFLLTFVTGMLVFKGPSEIVKMGIADAIWQPGMQGILVALGVLGISKIGRSS